MVWSALVAVAVAIWVAMSLGLLQTVRELRGLFGDRGPAVPVPGLFGVYGLYAAVLFAILAVGGQGPAPPLDHAAVRTRAILAIGLATAAPTVVTLWLVAERLRRLQPLLTAEAPLADAGDRIDEVRTLGRCSVRSLAAASVSVSLAVVLAGALRNALLAHDPDYWSEAFPASVLLLYGAFFTAAFAAVYMPTLLTLTWPVSCSLTWPVPTGPRTVAALSCGTDQPTRPTDPWSAAAASRWPRSGVSNPTRPGSRAVGCCCGSARMDPGCRSSPSPPRPR